jgi:hypothetical protein
MQYLMVMTASGVAARVRAALAVAALVGNLPTLQNMQH